MQDIRRARQEERDYHRMKREQEEAQMRRLNKGKAPVESQEDYWANFPKEVREVLEDNEDEYLLPFQEAAELLQIFEGLEGENLFLIQ